MSETEKIKSAEAPTLIISIAMPEDSEGITEVFYKTWLATYPNEEIGLTVEDIEDRYKNRFESAEIEKRKERIMNPPLGEKLLIAKDGEKVVGLCRVLMGDDRNQLQAIYVLPEYQGKGIGRLLWTEAQKFIDPSKDTYVELASYNTNAMDFYRRIGFVDTSRRMSNFKMKSGATIPEMEMVLKAKDVNH